MNQAQESTGIHFDLDAFIKLSLERARRKHKDTYIVAENIRLTYLVSVIIFCESGGHCSIPLHVLLTNYIEANDDSEKESGADRHLDIGLQVVEVHTMFPYFLEKRLAIPTSPIF